MRPVLVTDEIYHVYNRGVDKRTVFMSNREYLRAMHDLYDFNDLASSTNHGFMLKIGGLDKAPIATKRREPIVEIMAVALMPNHYHLLLRQLVDGGISLFMKKFGGGYTNYFNILYERSGALFQGKFKAVHVNSDSQLYHIPNYIHLNPVELWYPGWKTDGLSPQQVRDVLTKLEKYRWSSYPDYIGLRNYPSVTNRDFISALYGGEAGYKRTIEEWLSTPSLEEVNDISID